MLVELDGDHRSVRVAVSPAAARRQRLSITLTRVAGEPRLELAWLRALRPRTTLPAAPASQWVPAEQQALAAQR
jgi:hypothetical protein